MSDDLVTHSALAESLGVSDRTLQRLADAYSEVHDPLPRVTPRSRQRLFPQRAVERIRAAHQLMCDVPGMRAADALKVIRDGMTFWYCPANSSETNLPTPVMAELHALHSEITNLQGEVANLRTLLLALLEHGQVPLPGGPLGLRLDGPTDSPSTSQVFPQLPASWPVGLQPNLTRLLSDLQAGYALVEVRGEVVLLTPSGQQVRLVDPRAVAALVKQGWLARDGHSFCLTVPPLSRTQ